MTSPNSIGQRAHVSKEVTRGTSASRADTEKPFAQNEPPSIPQQSFTCLKTENHRLVFGRALC
jgi:hypothetical protein